MFRFYSDPALTTPLTSLALTTLLDDGVSSPVASVVYFGNPTDYRVLIPASESQITVAPADSNSGSGLPASAIKLALTESGLATATPGAAIELGASLTSGVSNAVSVWVSVSAGSAAAGSYADLSLVTNDLIEADDV